MAKLLEKILISDYFAHILKANLGRPTKTLGGRLATKLMEYRNGYLEESAVDILGIEPNHKVLEVGFGPGLGLIYATEKLKGGTGRIYGVDYSQFMVDRAKRVYSPEINEELLEIHHSTVTHLPFPDRTFDRAFHVNSYYFWPQMRLACRELKRVLKPEGLIVCTLCLDRLKKLKARDIFKVGSCRRSWTVQEGLRVPTTKNANIDPVNYMENLEAVGFKQVRIEYLKNAAGENFQAILASKPNELEEVEWNAQEFTREAKEFIENVADTHRKEIMRRKERPLSDLEKDKRRIIKRDDKKRR